MNKRVSSLLLTLVAVFYLVPTQGARAASNQNLVQLAQSNPELSTLVDAVVHAGLATTLATDGQFTVFAPTNSAFADLLADLGLTDITQAAPNVVADILLDHVIDDRVTAARLAFLARDDRTIDSLGGLILDFDRKPLEVNDVSVIASNVRASNGIVHVIDEVLRNPDPRPSIVDLAIATPDLSILVDIVVRLNLVTLLDAGKPFTVFAPTNAAFLDLLNQVGAASLDDIDDATLIAILLDHIVVGEYDQKDLNASRRAMGQLKLRFSGRRQRVNGQRIVIPDVEAANGTVHVIDGVLLGR